MKILPIHQIAFFTVTFFLTMSSVAFGQEVRYTSTFDPVSAQQTADAINGGNDPQYQAGTAHVVQGDFWRQSESGENLYRWDVYAVPAGSAPPDSGDPASCSGPDCE